MHFERSSRPGVGMLTCLLYELFLWAACRDEGGYTQSIIVGLGQYGKALDTLKAPMTLAV
jgi:hypothetical protein